MGATTAPKLGRPALYAVDLVDEFCRRVATGRSVIDVCQDDDMPSHQTVYKWQREQPYFTDSLAHARAERSEAFSSELRALGARAFSKGEDRVDPAALRVAIDAIDKAARIMQPRKVELTGRNGGPIQTQSFDPAKLAQLSQEELDALERAHRIIGLAAGDPSGEGEA